MAIYRLSGFIKKVGINMHLTQSELSRIFRSLGSLLHAGISPAEGIYLLAREEAGETAALLERIGQELDLGGVLSQVMADSGAFPAWAWAMVRVGEDTGRLEEATGFLADYCDEQLRTRRLLKQSFAYPCILFALMLGVIALLLMKVLPVFDRVYASLGSSLTGTAGILLMLGRWLEGSLPAVFILLAMLLVLLGAFRFCQPVRRALTGWYRIRLGDRGVNRKFNNARFARALAMGIGSGMTAEEAVSLAGQLLEELPGAARRCEEARKLLEEGAALDDALQQTDLLPPARGRMLAVGLRSGNVDRILTDLADRMEQDARQALEDTLSRVEPAMVLLCAALVGLILLSVMVPLLDILAALG